MDGQGGTHGADEGELGVQAAQVVLLQLLRVLIGVAVDDKTRVYRFVFSGNRETVIKKATTAAIFSALKLLTENFFEV